jgi:hypothetical protein
MLQYSVMHTAVSVGQQGTHTGAHTRTHTHTHTYTHTYTHTRCTRDGLRQFFSVASDTPTLV